MKAKLSMAFEDLRGSDGNVTARGSRSGLTLVKKINPRISDSEASLDVRGNMDEMGKTFRSLDQASKDAWDAFGGSSKKTNPVNGTTYSSTGYAAFVALNGVLLRSSDTSMPILMPPTVAFAAPSIGLAVSVETGAILVVGDDSTPSHVLLEVRVARLANITNKLPKDGYTSAGFFALTDAGGLSARIPETAGAYALQYRWVSATDGQASRFRSLGKFKVALSLEDGGVDAETGEVFAPVAKPARMKKAA